jgi:hypothetical protein
VDSGEWTKGIYIHKRTMKFTLNITNFDIKQCLVAINVNKHRYYSTNNNHNQNNNIETTIPIVSYLNPYKNRHEIYQDNNNKPGVYLIPQGFGLIW